MATEKECPFYKECGFVKWRRERPYEGIAALPPNGDCGKSVKQCGRADPDVPINVTVYGPAFDSEIKLGLPEIPSKDKRKPHRIVGGCHR